MARKLFHQLIGATPGGVAPVAPPAPATDDALHPIQVESPALNPVVEPSPEPNSGLRIRSARSLRGGLLEMSANAVRDLDPAAILEDGPRDRLDLDAAEIATLAESIRKHGQQVPILVRPTAEPDRYRVVYGRRRLAAARLLGVQVKALVRSLDDAASILAQGQENSLRLNPSFIEKAIFAGSLRDAGYDSGTIQDALGISRQALSLFTIVQKTIPIKVIEAIGPAHDIGRRRWMELADLARETNIDLGPVLDRVAQKLAKEPSSDKRFDLFYAAVKARPSPASERSETVLTAANGARLARIKRSGAQLSLSLADKDVGAFGAWFEDNAQDVLRQIYAEWQRKATE